MWWVLCKGFGFLKEISNRILRLTSSTVRPAFSCCKRSQSALLAVGSTPLDGSSNKTTFELAHKAIPTESFRFMPPDKLPAFESILFSSFSSLTYFSTSRLTSLLGSPFKRLKKSMCSRTVRSSNRMLCCGQRLLGTKQI